MLQTDGRMISSPPPAAPEVQLDDVADILHLLGSSSFPSCAPTLVRLCAARRRETAPALDGAISLVSMAALGPPSAAPDAAAADVPAAAPATAPATMMNLLAAAADVSSGVRCSS